MSSAFRTKLFRDFAVRTTALVKRGSGFLFAFHAQNRNAAIRYIQFYDQTTAPAAGDVPFAAFPIPAAGSLTLDQDFFTSEGIAFKNGLIWAYSTTETSYTAGTAGEQTTHITYA